MIRETASYTCPECRARIYALADEYGDHGCGRCGWEPSNLRKDIREYLDKCAETGLGTGRIREIDEIIAKETGSTLRI